MALFTTNLSLKYLFIYFCNFISRILSLVRLSQNVFFIKVVDDSAWPLDHDDLLRKQPDYNNNETHSDLLPAFSANREIGTEI